jgi:hypothetical protein
MAGKVAMVGEGVETRTWTSLIATLEIGSLKCTVAIDLRGG